jgi:hypothetical protein
VDFQVLILLIAVGIIYAFKRFLFEINEKGDETITETNICNQTIGNGNDKCIFQ